MDLIDEAAVECPHCGETIIIVLDLSVANQDYIEDCFVCCRPIRIRYAAEAGILSELTTDADS